MRLLARTLLLGSVVCLIAFDSPAQSGTTPPTPTATQATLVEGNTAFAFDLYHQLALEQDGNLIFSPYSISLNMALLYAGAKGETAAQMAKVLHFDLSQEKFHSAFKDLDLSLKRTQDEPLVPTPTIEYINPAVDLTLTIANGLWAQRGLPFNYDYLRTIQNNYGIDVKSVDFSGDPEGAQQTISHWVEENTRGRIKDMPAPGSITSQTQLALINAIYFKGEWTYPFDTRKTHDGTFNLLNGSPVTVPLMVGDFKEASCFRGDDYQTIELTYGQSENASMIILLPNAEEFHAFETGLSATSIARIRENLPQKRGLTFEMPRFRFESKFDLHDTLSIMGMSLPFGSNADFTGMIPQRGLGIGYAEHKATITVDEEGTEAIGVTATLSVLLGRGNDCSDEIIADRPFIFIVYDHQTNTILFMGRVMNPAA
ncbi:MAG: serpin family protein [Anaerolineaceae bacterium]|nr:serpin family protein [Anaerolineaceae bacterium]